MVLVQVSSLQDNQDLYPKAHTGNEKRLFNSHFYSAGVAVQDTCRRLKLYSEVKRLGLQRLR